MINANPVLKASNKSVTVVLSVYSIERANDVVACINSVKKQTVPPKEIILVLDPDEALISYYTNLLKDKVRIIVSNNFGLSFARNVGIQNSFSEIVAFIDDDAVADKNWLKNLVTNFDEDSVIGVGGKIIPLWPETKPVWFPEELFWIVGCSYKGLPLQKSLIRNPIGCNMAFRRSVFESVGYFSTNIGRVGDRLLGHEDTEFGIRATKRLPATKIIYDPEAIVYHHVSTNRIKLTYVLKRSYSEGFSKTVISKNSRLKTNSMLNTEMSFLKILLLSTPKLLLEGNIRTGILKVNTLWVSTAMVFFGYIIGLKYS